MRGDQMRPPVLLPLNIALYQKRAARPSLPFPKSVSMTFGHTNDVGEAGFVSSVHEDDAPLALP